MSPECAVRVRFSACATLCQRARLHDYSPRYSSRSGFLAAPPSPTASRSCHVQPIGLRGAPGGLPTWLPSSHPEALAPLRDQRCPAAAAMLDRAHVFFASVSVPGDAYHTDGCHLSPTSREDFLDAREPIRHVRRQTLSAVACD